MKAVKKTENSIRNNGVFFMLINKKAAHNYF